MSLFRNFMKPAMVALILGTAACGRDTVSPERAVLVPAQPSRDREEAGPLSGSSTTFEAFALGAIDGQYDWQSKGGLVLPVAGVPCAAYDHAIANYPAVVPVPFRDRSFGQQSLRISNAVTSGCYSDQTFSSRTANVAGQAGARSLSADGTIDFALPAATLQNHFEAEWTLMSAVPDALQPGLEVVASPARGDDLRMGWVQVADLPDGLAIVFAEWSNAASLAAATIVRSTIARGLDRRRAHTVRLTMDFLDGPDNDVVRVYVDGSLRRNGASWERYFALKGTAPPIVNRLLFRTGSDLLRGVPGDPAPATLGRGFVIDNLRQATFMVATSADACKNGGWRTLRDANGASFDNQADCVSWVRHAQRHDDDGR